MEEKFIKFRYKIGRILECNLVIEGKAPNKKYKDKLISIILEKTKILENEFLNAK